MNNDICYSFCLFIKLCDLFHCRLRFFPERASRERSDAFCFPASGFSASGIPAAPCSGAGP